jgi:hypothetical protein
MTPDLYFSSPSFDFTNPEYTLLLKQFPRVLPPPRNSLRLPLRPSPPRILKKWGLTNGIGNVMIDCVHGLKHPILHVNSAVLLCRATAGRETTGEACLGIMLSPAPGCMVTGFRLSAC